MWTGFAAACIVTVVLLYAPGFVSLLGTRYSLTMRLAFAPLVSIVLYSIIAITLSVMSLDATGLRVFIFAVAVALGIFLMMRAGATEPRCRVSTCLIKRELSFVSLYLLLGVVITAVIFVKNLDGPNSFLQEYDNVFHLGLIRVFLESGDYSPFCSSLYAAVGDLSVAPRQLLRKAEQFIPAHPPRSLLACFEPHLVFLFSRERATIFPPTQHAYPAAGQHSSIPQRKITDVRKETIDDTGVYRIIQQKKTFPPQELHVF